MTYAVEIVIHKTGTVASTRKDQAYNALATVDDDLEENYNPRTAGLDNLDNSEIDSGSESARASSVRYIEDKMYDTGWLDTTKVHVILYEQSVNLSSDNYFDGAGYANWEIYVPSSETDDFAETRQYEDSKGNYAFAFVNVSTGNWPYTKLIYKNTVAHEVGHTLGQDHSDGYIVSNSGDSEATPMVTWYVESDCGSHWPDNSVSSMCAGVDSEACYHRLEHSTCARDGIDSHIQNNQ